MADLSHLPTDTSGAPCRFLNHYRCDACDEEWSDRWSCACDDDCPSCGASISPHDYDEEDEAMIVIWALPYNPDVAKDALGHFTPAEAAALLGMDQAEIAAKLNAASSFQTEAYHVESDE